MNYRGCGNFSEPKLCGDGAAGTIFQVFPLSPIELKARVRKMLEACQSSRIVPYGADQTLFVVVDRVTPSSEIRSERTDLEATIRDLFAGCFSDPVRVISFNTLEHWVKDVSTEIAVEIQSRCDIDGTELPDHLRDFVESHICRAGHAAMPDVAAQRSGQRRRIAPR